MPESLPPLGDGGMNLPYEDNPEPFETTIDARTAGGVTAATTEVDGHHYPAVIFRFAQPDGQFMEPIMLIARPAELEGLVMVARDTVRGAIRGAAERGRARG